MKKLLFMFFLVSFLFFIPLSNFNHIDYNQTLLAEVSEDFDQILKEQLDDLDFSNIEEIFNDLNETQKSVFGEKSFAEKVYMIITGEVSGFENIWDLLKALLFDNILSLLPLIATIVAISILGGMIGNITSKNGNSMGNIVHFIIYGVVVLMLTTIIVKMINLTTTTLNLIKLQTDAIFPILLTTLTALGGTTSVSAYQPTIAIFSSFIIEIFTNFILPLFLISIVLNLVSNLSNSVKLNKLISFVNSLSKWTIGIIFTLFTGFVTIQGISAGTVDGLSIKTAKFTIKNSLPIVGGYLSDGLFLILASSNLIKNVVGGAGLLLLIITMLSPIIELVMFILALKLMAGIIEPLGEGRIANFILSISKSMVMLITTISVVSFMYVILTGLVMCSANVI